MRRRTEVSRCWVGLEGVRGDEGGHALLHNLLGFVRRLVGRLCLTLRHAILRRGSSGRVHCIEFSMRS
jgi:hypothetical protein